MSISSEIKSIKAILFPVREERPATKIDLAHQILVGTHHKAGTVWLLKIFKKVCEEFGLRLCHGEISQIPQECDVILPRHSRFDFEQLQKEWRGVHLIRDPRDVIVSGCFYHGQSQEAWLHVKRAGYGGLSYQEKLNSYVSMEDRILFEMENWGQSCIRGMLQWNYNDPAFFEVKYEDLISDHQLVLFHTIFAFLGFPGHAIPQSLKISYENSLFSGMLAKTSHIRSGQIRQWEKYFTPALDRRFRELFGDEALGMLGYEDNGEWAAPELRQVTYRIHSAAHRAHRRIKPTDLNSAWGRREAA
jgi:hypothetical protein